MVQVKFNAENKAIHTYKGSPLFGYIHLESTEMIINGAWIGEKNRSTLLRGSVELLEKFANAMIKNGQLTGRISVSEFKENELPENFKARLSDKVSYEESIDQYIKRTGKDGQDLTNEGQRILRFTDYDPTGTRPDIHVQHDNVEEVKAWNATYKASAQLPS